MADARAGAVRIDLTADAGEFRRGLEGGAAALDRFGQRLTAATRTAVLQASALEGSFRLVFRALQTSFRNGLEDILQMDRLAASSGIAIGQLHALRLAAEQSGVSFETLSGAIQQYSNNVAEAGQNQTSKFAQSLALIGVKLRDSNGEIKGFDQLLTDVSAKLANYADGAGKAAVGTSIFGEKWKELAPLVRDGALSMEEATRRAAEMGGRFGGATTKETDDFKKASVELSAAIAEMNREFTKLAAGPLGAVSRGVSAMIRSFREWLDSSELKTAQLEVYSLEQQLEHLRASQEGNLFGHDWTEEIKALEGELAKAKDRLAELQALKIDVPLPIAPKEPLDTTPLTKAREDLDAVMDRLSGLPYLMGQAFAFDDRPFQEALAKVESAKDLAVISDQQRNALRLRLARMEQAEILNTASLVADTLTTVFQKSKLASIAAAIINTSVAVTKALSGSPPPFNFVNAALVAAAGAAQIAQIRSTTQNGGGAVSPPSGGGASATTSGQSQGEGQGQGSAPIEHILQIKGLTTPGLFNNDFVRELVETIGDFTRDGGKVVVVS